MARGLHNSPLCPPNKSANRTPIGGSSDKIRYDMTIHTLRNTTQNPYQFCSREKNAHSLASSGGT